MLGVLETDDLRIGVPNLRQKNTKDLSERNSNDSDETLRHSNVSKSYSTDTSFMLPSLKSSSTESSNVWIYESKHSESSDILFSDDASYSPYDTYRSASIDDDEPLTMCGFEVIPIEEELCTSYHNLFQVTDKLYSNRSLAKKVPNPSTYVNKYISAAKAAFECGEIKEVSHETKLTTCESEIFSVINSPSNYHHGDIIMPTKNCDLSHIAIVPKLSVDLNDDTFSFSSNHSDEPHYLDSPLPTKTPLSDFKFCKCSCIKSKTCKNCNEIQTPLQAAGISNQSEVSVKNINKKTKSRRNMLSFRKKKSESSKNLVMDERDDNHKAFRKYSTLSSASGKNSENVKFKTHDSETKKQISKLNYVTKNLNSRPKLEKSLLSKERLAITTKGSF